MSHDNINDAIAELGVKFGLHLVFEVSDFCKACTIFESQAQIDLRKISGFVRIDRMELRVAVIVVSQYCTSLK